VIGFGLGAGAYETGSVGYPQHFTLEKDGNIWTLENAGEKVYLRVELQSLFRLPRSNSMLFGIRAYLCSFANMAKYNLAMCKRAHRVLENLPFRHSWLSS